MLFSPLSMPWFMYAHHWRQFPKRTSHIQTLKELEGQSVFAVQLVCCHFQLTDFVTIILTIFFSILIWKLRSVNNHCFAASSTGQCCNSACECKKYVDVWCKCKFIKLWHNEVASSDWAWLVWWQSGARGNGAYVNFSHQSLMRECQVSFL